MTGGDARVADILDKGSRREIREKLLEGDEEKGFTHQSSFRDFFCQPSVLGNDLYVIEKFGLVQYVSPHIIFNIVYVWVYTNPNFSFCS